MASDNIDQISPVLQLPSFGGMNQPGVYFLLQGSEVVYVGQATDVRRRLGQHISEGSKEFDGISFIPVPLEKLDAIERGHILRLLPKYNKCKESSAIRSRMEQCGVTLPQAPIGGALMTEEDAAAFLGVRPEKLIEWRDAGLVWPIRLRRSPARRYKVDQLRDFAIAHRDLLQAA